MTFLAWLRGRRESAKRMLDEALERARRFGSCDGRGECTSLLSHVTRGSGRRYSDDCGRPVWRT